jgi:hypothetical protein
MYFLGGTDILNNTTLNTYIYRLNRNNQELANFLIKTPKHEEILLDAMQKYNTPLVAIAELKKYRLEHEPYLYDIDTLSEMMLNKKYKDIHKILQQIFLEPFAYSWFQQFIKKGKDVVGLLEWHEQHPTERFVKYLIV